MCNILCSLLDCDSALAVSHWVADDSFVVVCVIVALYVGAPLYVKWQQAKPAEAKFISIDASQVSPETAALFRDAAATLAYLGFECLGYAARDVARTRQNSYVSVWTHPVTLDTAQVIGILTPTPHPHLRVVTLVAFRTEFTDRTAIVTANSTNSGCFPPDPLVSTVNCPGVHDLIFLCHLHHARVTRDRGHRVPTLDRYPGAAARLELEHGNTFNRLCAAGEYKLGAAERRYVPTFRGAFFMTYRLLPPWKQLRSLKRARLRDRTLRELNLANPRVLRQA